MSEICLLSLIIQLACLGALGGQKTSATSNSIFNLDCSTSTLIQMMQLQFGHATSILASKSGDATSTSPNATSNSANATSTLSMQLRFWQCNFNFTNATSTLPVQLRFWQCNFTNATSTSLLR
jgi:hypothetical protein